MKYILFCTIALVLCFAIAMLITKIVYKKIKRKTGKTETVIVTVVLCLILYILTALGYLSVYYHADKDAVNKAMTLPGISVTQLKDDKQRGYAFLKEENSSALVFFAGAKVDELAYSPLMAKLADGGVDCYLLEIPFHMAIFVGNEPDWIIETYSDKNYDSWMVGGHSMGGIVAVNYAVNNADIIDGIVLLASYPTTKVPDNIALCSIYGSNDKCLDLKEYESHKVNYPAVSIEHIIDGGNHAQFASYGFQKGDGISTVTPEMQVQKTAAIILEFKENSIH